MAQEGPTLIEVTKKSSFESLEQHLNLIDEGIIDTQNSISDSDFSQQRTCRINSFVSSSKPAYRPSIFANVKQDQI